jgi:hypothetical protein
MTCQTKKLQQEQHKQNNINRNLSYAHIQMSFSLFNGVAVINAQRILLIAHTSRHRQKKPMLYKGNIIRPNTRPFFLFRKLQCI